MRYEILTEEAVLNGKVRDELRNSHLKLRPEGKMTLSEEMCCLCKGVELNIIQQYWCLRGPLFASYSGFFFISFPELEDR